MKLGIESYEIPSQNIEQELVNLYEDIDKSEVSTDMQGYFSMIKKRDNFISTLNIGYMDPHDYFVLNQKNIFLNSLDSQQMIKNDIDMINKELKKMGNVINDNPIYTIGLALKIISTIDGYQGLKPLVGEITDEFDIDMINSYGYLQSLFPDLQRELNGGMMPTWTLGHKTLEKILELLKNNDIKTENESIIEKKYEDEDKEIKVNGDIDVDVERVKKDVKIKEIEDKDNVVVVKKKLNNTIIKNNSKIENTYMDDYDDMTIIEKKVEDEDVINENTVNKDDKIKSNNDKGSIDDQNEVINENLISTEKKTNIVTNPDENTKTIVKKRKTNNTIIQNNSEIVDTNTNDYDDMSIIEKKADKKIENKDIINDSNSIETKINNQEGKKGGINLGEILGIDIGQDPILDVVKDMSWNADTLSGYLSIDKLQNVSYQQIIDAVEGFRFSELKKAFMFALLHDDVVSAQKLVGMELDCHRRYPNYKAKKKLGLTELNKIEKLGKSRRYMESNEILDNKHIPVDLKIAYNKFLNNELDNKSAPYSILSKTDFRIYLFSADHKLLSRQDTLVGKSVGDTKNNPYKGYKTTPGGIYEIGVSAEKDDEGDDFFANYGTHYILMIPKENQYDMGKYTIGLHGLYKNEYSSRLAAIKSRNSNDHRKSTGCVNLYPDTFGEIYNHLKMGRILYITPE